MTTARPKPDMRRTFHACLLALLAAVFLLMQGCATANLPNVGPSCYYQHCVGPLVELQKRDAEIAKNTATGALGGALAGAVIGYVSSGSFTGALIGAGIGAIGVGGISYTFTKLEQVADENTRFASIRVTANQDLTKANRLQLYSYESMACYVREFDHLQDAYESGALSREEYAKRFREIRQAMVALGEVIGNVESDIQRTEREFNASFARGPKAPPPAVAPPPASALPVEPAPAISAQPQPLPAARKAAKRRVGSRVSDAMARNKKRVEQTQAKNDDDLAAMLDDFAGKVTPPPQNVAAIKQDYGRGYAAARRQNDELRAVHREALSIMDAAALEAGIDMI